MELKRIIELIEKNELKRLMLEFKDFDRAAYSINDYQKKWGLPLEPNSCQLAHKLRNELLVFIVNYEKGFETLAVEVYLKDILQLAKQINEINNELTNVYKKVCKILY